MDFRRLYEDDDFESELRDIIFNDCDFSEVIEENNFYEYHYFLSHLRHNLFKWYPFKKQGILLEIGASYGQLTELFTQKVNHVVCVEDSQSKADIISKRVDNAEVLISEFDNIDIDEKFDYIILCNIFEYAKTFKDSKNPYKDYLSYLRNFLKEDGVILIAISNRLGLNYFAGFKEEHSNQLFAGLNGYANVNYVETFSKTELEELILSSGFSNYKFFYPYPNHEFPLIINTDKFVNKIPFERRLDYFDNRYNLFREDVLNQLFAKDGIAAYFSNSFLVEIRNSDMEFPTDNIEFVKLNSDRVEKFRTITTIDSDGYVYKSSSSVKSNDHIFNMYEQSKFPLGKINYLDCELIDNSIKYGLLKEESLETLILESILQDDKKEFFRLLEDYYDALFYESFESQDYAKSQFLEIFKERSNAKFHCHERSNLDLIFSNIFIIDDEYVAIDYEWTFDFEIPLEYIFYRVLLHYTLTNKVFKEFISINEIFNHFGLDTSHFNLFRTWDHNFMEYVFGYLPKPPQNILQIVTKDSEEEVSDDDEVDEYVNLYLNSDEVDEEKLEFLKRDMVINQRRIIVEKNNQITNLNKQINSKNRQINNLKNQINNLNGKIKDSNYNSINNHMNNLSNQMNNLSNQMNNQITALNNQINHKNIEIGEKNKKISEYESSNSWKITAPLRKFIRFLNKRKGD
ncbi:MAG: methyltransferase domain-containing protein [Methanobrevibacter sp.]|uniref:SAM-dependent methyltransferase n=1 Tax=Methanobrevibacter sp. TaxID=66852 RepID=UPI002E75D1A8|nr:methyltransferase domain-containing protein [Methanobrevibacter sp.]MEE0935637.1 methyltransferase domain-containing protein [Methanobrevibacter sp.]